MKIIKKAYLLPFLVSPFAMADDGIEYGDYRAANTPVNYSFINLEVGNKSFEELDNDMMVARVSGQTLLNDSFIFKLGYQADLLDETNDGTEISYQDNLANIGVGWRYPLFKTTDIEVDGHLLYNWNDGVLNNDVEQSDLGYRVGIAINQGIGDSFDMTLGINHTEIADRSITAAELSFTQYITEYVGIGINAHMAKRDDLLGDLNYIGVHMKLAFY